MIQQAASTNIADGVSHPLNSIGNLLLAVQGGASLSRRRMSTVSEGSLCATVVLELSSTLRKKLVDVTSPRADDCDMPVRGEKERGHMRPLDDGFGEGHTQMACVIQFVVM